MVCRVAPGLGFSHPLSFFVRSIPSGLAVLLVFALVQFVPSNQATAAPIVSTSPAPLTESVIGARFRAFRTLPGEHELYVGVPDLGNGPPQRAQVNAVWAPTNTISLVYDDITQTLTGSIANVNGTFSAVYDLAANPPSDFGKTTPLDMINAMNITLFERKRPSDPNNPTSTLSNIVVNGNALPNVVGGLGPNNISTLSITNLSFQLGFEWSATLELSGTFDNSAERNRLDISLGFDPTSRIVPEPELAALALIGFGGVMMARRQRRHKAQRHAG